MKKVLVLCTGNSCRSQMAEGYLRNFAGNRALIYSAGIEANGLNPRAVAAMKEDGIDISGQRSKGIQEFAGLDFDYVITVCDHARELCPVFPSGVLKFHRDFPDPARFRGSGQQIKEQFARVRDQIREYCRDFALNYLG